MRLPRLSLLLVISAACGSSSSGSPSNTAAATGPTVRFDLTTSPTPAFMAVPFPSDIYLQGGKVVVPGMDGVVKENSQFISSELAKMDGFSRVALTDFYVDDTAAP